MSRTTLALAMVVAGFIVQVTAYLFLAAPLGRPTSPAFSNPRLQFAPLIFVFGVILVFLAAVVYEVKPDKSG